MVLKLAKGIILEINFPFFLKEDSEKISTQASPREGTFYILFMFFFYL